MMKAYKSPYGNPTIVDTGHSMFVRVAAMEQGVTYVIETKEDGKVVDFEELHEGMTVYAIFEFVDENYKA